MFNDEKYKKCINHLIERKYLILLSYIIIFSCIGLGIGFPIMLELVHNYTPVIVGVICGFFSGLYLGLNSIWKVELKIQELYWKSEMLEEIKKYNSNKSLPMAKTVVLVENNQAPSGSENRVKVEEK